MKTPGATYFWISTLCRNGREKTPPSITIRVRAERIAVMTTAVAMTVEPVGADRHRVGNPVIAGIQSGGHRAPRALSGLIFRLW